MDVCCVEAGDDDFGENDEMGLVVAEEDGVLEIVDNCFGVEDEVWLCDSEDMEALEEVLVLEEVDVECRVVVMGSVEVAKRLTVLVAGFLVAVLENDLGVETVDVAKRLTTLEDDLFVVAVDDCFGVEVEVWLDERAEV